MPCCALTDWGTMKSDAWVSARDVRNYADGHLTVTITLAEYRELCGKAALWDSYSADVERWATGGDDDDADRS